MHLCRFSFKFILKTQIVYFLVYNCLSFPKEEQLYLNHYALKLIANAVLNSLKYVQTTIFILHTVKKLGNPVLKFTYFRCYENPSLICFLCPWLICATRRYCEG